MSRGFGYFCIIGCPLSELIVRCICNVHHEDFNRRSTTEDDDKAVLPVAWHACVPHCEKNAHEVR